MKYHQLKYVDNGCKRRTLFYLKGIEGVRQFYPIKKRYIKSKIYEHIADAFDIENNYEVSIPDEFSDRLNEAEEEANKLIENLDAMIEEFDIEMGEIRRKCICAVDGKEIEFTIDAIGKFEGDLTIFSINPTARSKTDNLKELAFIDSFEQFVNSYATSNPQRIIELKLGSGKYREAPREGEMTKSGRPKKNGLGSWDELADEVKEGRIIESLKIQKDMMESPQDYNIPTFGGCATCPFHNVPITYDGRTFVCKG